MALPELHPLRRPRTVAEACCLVADVGLLGVLWVAPLAMGGRFPVGRLLLVALIVLVAASWFSAKLFSERRVWRWSGAELLVGLAIALVAFQLVPLPTTTVAKLSPAIRQLLILQSEQPELLSESQTVAGWGRISLVPHATRAGLSMAIAYGLMPELRKSLLRGKKRLLIT